VAGVSIINSATIWTPVFGTRASARGHRFALRIVAALVLLTSPMWSYVLFFGNPLQPPGVEFVVIPGLVVFAIVAIHYATVREDFLRQTLMVAVFLRLAACGLYIYVSFTVYRAAADVVRYNTVATILLREFETSGHYRILDPIWSSNFISMLTRDIYFVFGTSMLTAMVVFTLLALIGLYLFYRAFCLVYPLGNRGLLAILLFLAPSLTFWSSAIGKDALMVFFLGSAVFGYACLVHQRPGKGFAFLTFGMAGVTAVRPHVGAMFMIALLVPYVLTRPGRGAFGVLLKIATIPVMLIALLWIGDKAQEFVRVREVAEVESRLTGIGEGNRTGSAFGAASVGGRILYSPFFFFRPFPWEVTNALAAVAAAEGLVVLILCLRQRKWFWTLIRISSSNVFTYFMIFFLAELAIVLSTAITNFGLLSRQRIAALPLLFMLLCIQGKVTPSGSERPSRGMMRPLAASARP